MWKKVLKIIKSRFFIFGLIVIILFVILGVRLAYITVEKGEYYSNLAKEKKATDITLKGTRGSIYDRNGIPLAVNKQINIVQVDRQWLPTTHKEINDILYEVVEIIEENGDTLQDNIPIKYGYNVYDGGVVPSAVLGYYYDFGTDDTEKHQDRYDAWRKDVGIDKNIDLPAEEMLKYLRERFKIDEEVSDEMARNIISIRLDLYLNRFKQDEPIRIAEDVGLDTVSLINTHSDRLLGIQTVIESGRYYPYGTSAQHIVGYVGEITDNNIESYNSEHGHSMEEDGYNVFTDKYGQDGVEAYAEEWLTGSTKDKQGYMKAEVDASRKVIQVIEEESPTNGDDVYLTLDMRLQRMAEKVLEEETYKMREGLESYEKNQAPLANTGAIVILDVDTGEILAMASYANSEYEYNLNDFARGINTEEYKNLSNDSSKPLLPIAFQGRLEPGSVFKMVVSMAALEEGAVGINETIYDNTRLNEYAPRCWSSYSHGYLNIMDALKVSCNYYFTVIGSRMNFDRFHYWTKAYGLEGSTGLELLQFGGRTDNNVVSSPEVRESQGLNWSNNDYYGTFIGQGATSVSPLAVSRYIAALVNGNKVLETHILKSVQSSEGQIVYETQPKYEVLDVKEENIAAVKEGMRRVIYEVGGTGKSAFNGTDPIDPSITLGGKTGTAQIIPDKSERNNAWFTGFTPYEDPEIAVVVAIPNGVTGGNAARIARRVIEEYYRIQDVNQHSVLSPSNELNP